jgi:hypothetical protein
MKFRILAVVVMVIGMICAAALAADINGKWVAELPGRGGGDPMTMAFNFKVDGSNLTGSMKGPQGEDQAISEGKISGDNISFVIKMDFGGNEMKINYKGKVVGSEIKLTMEFQGGMMGGPGGGGPGGGGQGGEAPKPPELTLKRAK